ncbi:MAG: MBL fold metallo-hydrolase [Synergistaceae bacterium]|nr:MBL fold metallo-hydrolase [Synergistaceae bacterium]MBR0034188.1 MBL fold metallo-hydrolase [Synergistaceae bacterium]
MPQDYRFIALGGGNETGGSCYALKLGKSIIILDAGIRITANFLNRIPDVRPLYERWGLEGLWDIDALVISHSHNDHTGALPVFVRDMNTVKVYSSQGTPDMLYAQNNVLRRDDITSLSDMIITVPFGEKYYINDFALTLFPAGHIPGAAMTLIENEACRILYTGDFCDFDQLTVKGAQIPDIKIDTLICETTYGYKQSIGRLDVHDLAGKINTILNYTDIFTCTFRNSGKSAEIAAAINLCADTGLIPDMDIWIDDSCLEICRVCEKWGSAKIFNGRTKPLGRYYYGIRGCVVSSGSSGGLYDLGFNMSNHADCGGILNLIARTKPDRVIFVHGLPVSDGTRNILQEITERFGGSAIEALHSINGQELNLLRE